MSSRSGRSLQWRRDDAFARDAEQAHEGVVDVHDSQVVAPQHHGIHAAVEDGAVLLFLRQLRGEGRAALGDVARERQHVRASVDRDRLQAHFVPVQAAVLVAPVPFERRAAVELGQLDPALRVVSV